jgi:hydrogenase nickel incorporation protein HypA/HybF
MHESSLMTDLMRQIGRAAATNGASRVVRVSVRLGALSGISATHFTEHFMRAAAGSVAENARLTVHVSQDLGDSRAQDIVLESVEVES